jgi:hypothetical protein
MEYKKINLWNNVFTYGVDIKKHYLKMAGWIT